MGISETLPATTAIRPTLGVRPMLKTFNFTGKCCVFIRIVLAEERCVSARKHTTTQSIEVPVTREQLVVERVPVSGQRVASDANFTGQEIRIPLSEERAHVEKQGVVREEVRTGKKEVTNVESFDEQVRSEELKVDQNGQKVVDKTA